MKTKITLFILLLKLANINAQPTQLKSANQLYEQYAYIDAIKIYEKVANQGYKSYELFSKLGNSYYFQSNFKEANKWYEKLIMLNEKTESEYFFRYAQTLKSIENYSEANKFMNQFYELNDNENRTKLGKPKTNYLEEIKTNSDRYKISNAGINSKYSDYGAAYIDNNLVFTSSRLAPNNEINKWNGQPNSNLFIAEINSSNNFELPKLFSKHINTKYNESSAAFTKDGKTMYFTRNNFLNNKEKSDHTQTILLKIFKAEKVKGEWTNIVELPFNSDDYSTAHPALSTDEKTLYFVSNMPGTFGNKESDIFKVKINEDGTYGLPENMGNKINTEGKESFPFVSEDNHLYFSSNGHPGLGGLDIFVTPLKEDGTCGIAKNLGAPVNSNMDDFAFYINTKTKKGFISSNRIEDNLGFDDIYKIEELIPLVDEIQKVLEGKVVEMNSQIPISDAKILVLNSNENLVNEQITNTDGKFELKNIPQDSKITVRISKDGYQTKEFKLTESDSLDKLNFELISNKIKIGNSLKDQLNLELVYFDLDKYNINSETEIELAKILAILNHYPKMKLEIQSHTDCRQSENYNLFLSNKRAKSIKKWLVNKGIKEERLKTVGYGESKLLIDCFCERNNPNNCTEVEHKKNRRTEFIILEY